MSQPPSMPAGWYPDPAGGGLQRWWNGVGWSDQTQPAAMPAPVPAPMPPVGQVPPPPPGYGGNAPIQYAPVSTRMRARRGKNSFAFTTLGVVAVYLVLAVATHIVFIGIFPVLMAVRSIRAREPLAPVAITAAVIAVIVAFAVLSGH